MTITMNEYENLRELKKIVKQKEAKIIELEKQIIADTKTITRLSDEIHNAKMRMEK